MIKRRALALDLGLTVIKYRYQKITPPFQVHKNNEIYALNLGGSAQVFSSSICRINAQYYTDLHRKGIATGVEIATGKPLRGCTANSLIKLKFGSHKISRNTNTSKHPPRETFVHINIKCARCDDLIWALIPLARV